MLLQIYAAESIIIQALIDSTSVDELYTYPLDMRADIFDACSEVQYNMPFFLLFRSGIRPLA